MKTVLRCVVAAAFNALLIALLATGPASAQQREVPPLATSLNPKETALILVDFQGNFVHPDGAWYAKFKPEFERTKMLEKTVNLVKQARAKGIWVIHVTEGYTPDYRELDWTNPGGFHRGQLQRQAWKIGSKEAAYYEPLKPGPDDKDLVLAPRNQASAFGGTGLAEVLRSKGVKNVAIAGFTTDVCNYVTVVAAYDLGFHVYALREAMIGFYPEMAQQMLNNAYPMWSAVVDNQAWLAMFDRP